MTIVEFLNARLNEEEQAAKEATRAEPGEPDRPWVVDEDGVSVGPRDSCGRDTCAWSVVYARESDDDGDALPAAANAAHIALHDPARVLREVEAKRKIVEECARADVSDVGDFAAVNLADLVLQQLASVYSDHKDYATIE